MASDKIHLYRDKFAGKPHWFIHCPACRYSYIRPTKKKAMMFATTHRNTHDPVLEIAR